MYFLELKINFTTNYPFFKKTSKIEKEIKIIPISDLIFEKVKNKNIKSFSKNKIFLKNFILFYFLLNYFFEKNNLVENKIKNEKFFLKCKFLTKKKKFNRFTLLRAPFRHKLSKKKFIINRYNHSLIFFFKKNYLNKKHVFWIKKFFKFFFFNIDNNLIHQQNMGLKLGVFF